MQGWPVGFEYLGTDNNLVFLSFPICYLNPKQAKRLAYYILDYRFAGETTNIFTQRNNIENIIVWPNSASQTINIKCPQQGEVFIYNVLGKIIHSKTVKDGINQLNTSIIKDGYYLIVFKSEKDITTSKVMIAH